MMDLRELYQDIILDHGRHPRNFRAMEQPTHFAQGHNPLCGDRVTVYLTLDGDRISDVSFQGRGCAISTAAASLMTEVLKGKTVADARALFAQFHARVTGGASGELSGAARRGDGAARAVDRRQGVSRPGQMRDLVVACARSGAERRRRHDCKDGVRHGARSLRLCAGPGCRRGRGRAPRGRRGRSGADGACAGGA